MEGKKRKDRKVGKERKVENEGRSDILGMYVVDKEGKTLDSSVRRMEKR